MIRPLIALLGCALLAPVQAAESYDNCTGTIVSLPATLSTQGTWCLKGNLATGITSGAAITIAANNITIDCNDFKVGGLSAGASTNAVGVSGTDVLNATIRRCGIRGFLEGIRLDGTSAGGLIEHNRLDQNTVAGITIAGDNHMVRFNRVVDTGGRPDSSQTDGIASTADEAQITDNSVVGMTVTQADGDVVGISSMGNASEIARNYVSGLVPAGPNGDGFGIITGNSAGSSIHRNQLLSFPGVHGTAIVSGADNQCGNNSHSNYDSGIVGCLDGGGNVGN